VPGVHVSRLIRIEQLSCACKKRVEMIKKRRTAVFFTDEILVKVKEASGDSNNCSFHKNKFLWKE